MSDAPLPEPTAVCDGGDLDCGSGLLLIIREAMAPLDAGGVLEVRSTETSVAVDLPAWCRMVGHALLGDLPGDGRYRHYRIRKQSDDLDLASDLEKARDFTFKVRVRWTGPMRASAYARNHVIPIGQPASFEVEDAAPSAIETLLSALGGCLAVGFAWRAARAGFEIHDLELALEARSDNILVFLGIDEEGHPGVSVTGKAFVMASGDQDGLRDLFAETVRRSPVAQTLLRGSVVDLDLRCM